MNDRVQLRVHHPASILVLPDGSVHHYGKLHGQYSEDLLKRAIVVLNPEECTTEGILAAISNGSSRRAFITPSTFEQMIELSIKEEESSSLLLPPAPTSSGPSKSLPGLPVSAQSIQKVSTLKPDEKEKIRRELFQKTFCASDAEYQLYKDASSSESKKEVLKTIYDRHVKFISDNINAIEQGAKSLLSTPPYGQKIGQQLLRDYQKLADSLSDLVKDVDPDILTIAQDAGLRLCALKDAESFMARENKSAGYFGPYGMEIVILDKTLWDKKDKITGGIAQRVLNEEFVHFADFIFKTTSQPQWRTACNKDMQPPSAFNTSPLKPTPALSMLIIYQALAKKGSCEPHLIPTEALADIANIDSLYEEIAKKTQLILKKGFPSSPEGPKNLDQAALFALAKLVENKLFTEDGNLRPKEEALAEIFPNIWPEYEKFREQIHECAQQIREKTHVDNTWATYITQQPATSTSLPD